MRVRASATPRIMECPGSLAMPEKYNSPSSKDARAGTLVHELLAAYITGGGGEARIDATVRAQQEGLDWEEIDWLFCRGRDWWNQNMIGMEEVRTEQEFSRALSNDLELTGHADVVGKLDGRQVIVDWKTGAVPVSHRHQGLSYAVLAGGWERGLSTVFITVWLRLGDITTEVFTPTDVFNFVEELKKVAAAENPLFTPGGECCRYCPHRQECPALRDALQSTAQTAYAVVGAANMAPEITPESLVALKPRIDLLKKALDAYDEALKDAIRDAGGKLGNLELRPQKRTSIPLTEKACEVLREQGVLDKVLSGASVSLSGMKKSVGKGAKAVETALSAQGLIIERLEERLFTVKGENDDSK